MVWTSDVLAGGWQSSFDQVIIFRIEDEAIQTRYSHLPCSLSSCPTEVLDAFMQGLLLLKMDHCPALAQCSACRCPPELPLDAQVLSSHLD